MEGETFRDCGGVIFSCITGRDIRNRTYTFARAAREYDPPHCDFPENPTKWKNGSVWCVWRGMPLRFCQTPFNMIWSDLLLRLRGRTTLRLVVNYVPHIFVGKVLTVALAKADTSACSEAAVEWRTCFDKAMRSALSLDLVGNHDLLKICAGTHYKLCIDQSTFNLHLTLPSMPGNHNVERRTLGNARSKDSSRFCVRSVNNKNN